MSAASRSRPPPRGRNAFRAPTPAEIRACRSPRVDSSARSSPLQLGRNIHATEHLAIEGFYRPIPYSPLFAVSNHSKSGGEDKNEYSSQTANERRAGNRRPPEAASDPQGSASRSGGAGGSPRAA